MQAGRLDRRVTIQELAASGRTAMGAPNTAWADVATVWANVRPLRGVALFAAQEQQSGYEVEIEMYYRPGVEAAMRAIVLAANGDETYDIKAVDTTQRQRGRMVLQCMRGLNEG